MNELQDGNAGVFGDKVTPTMIARLDEQYPGQDDFKQGYVDGFREGATSRTGDKRVKRGRRREIVENDWFAGLRRLASSTAVSHRTHRAIDFPRKDKGRRNSLHKDLPCL